MKKTLTFLELGQSAAAVTMIFSEKNELRRMWYHQADLQLQVTCSCRSAWRSSLLFHLTRGVPVSHCSCVGFDLASFLKKLTKPASPTWQKNSLESVESISFFPKLGYAHKVKKSFDLKADFFCVHQQHITKEDSQFFFNQKFFLHWIIVKKHWK